MSIDKSFLGKGWGFPPEFNSLTKEVKMVTEDEDIKESLNILFSTNPGERIMRPTYGCRLKTMVFETITLNIITEIKDIVDRAVLFFEPRISLNSVEVNIQKQYEGRVDIILDYTIRTTNSRSNMVYPFYFMEGTDL